MSARSDIVSYTWNTLDGLSAQVGVNCSPYKIPASMLNDAAAWQTKKTVLLPLSLSAEPATLGRFFRDGYEWVPIPDGVQASTLMDLFVKLFDYDKKRFAHLDPLLVMASAAAADAAKIKALAGNSMGTSGADPALSAAHALLTAPSLIDPTMVPFADLAFTHFDYWENSALRCEMFDEMFKRVVPPSSTSWDFTLAGIISPRFPLAIPWAGFFGGLMAMVAPQAIPVEKNGKKIEKVLARKALQGVPIRALATPKGAPEKAITVLSLEPPRIELDGWTTQTVAPIYLNEWNTKESKLRFRLTLPVSAQKTVLEIVHERAVIFRQEHNLGEFIVPGVHLWYWDCFDDRGIFDTKVLKSNELEARLTVTDMSGRVATAKTEIGTGPGNIRWTDVKIDTANKRVEVVVYARFSNPSEVELASLKIPLPAGTGKAITSMLDPIAGERGFSLIPMAAAIPGVGSNIPQASNLPISELTNNDQVSLSMGIPKTFDLGEARFDQFKADILFGIGFHWSRTVTLDGQDYSMEVSCKERASDCVRTFLSEAAPKALQDLGIGDGSNFGSDAGSRSFNLAAFMEGLPIVDIWDNTDQQFNRRYVGAHELGHSVLREAYDPVYSICHKGTSSVGQERLPTGPLVPTSGEIDVMNYWAPGASIPEEGYARVRASHDDARALIWMSKVVFG